MRRREQRRFSPGLNPNTSLSAFNYIDERYADHRDPLTWSLMTGIQPRRRERIQQVASAFNTVTEESGRLNRRDRPARSGHRATRRTAAWRRATSHVPSILNAPPAPACARESMHAPMHAAQQSQCSRPAPTRPKHTLDAPPSTQANPTRNFWAVSQAEPTRNAATRRRFPRSAKPTANKPRRKPHRSPGPMAKSAPISCETAQNPQGRAHGQGRGSR